MRELRFRPKARADLLEIWQYLAADDVPTANRIGEEFDQAIRALAIIPGKGRRRADVKSDRYWFLCVYSWVIAYRYDDKSVTIIRVVHGRRDFRKLFKA